MINKIKNKFSIKIFLMTFVLFLFVSGGTFLTVSTLIPSVYTNTLNENLSQVVDQTLDDFSTQNDINECIELLKNLENENMFWIYDDNGVNLYSSDNSQREQENYKDYFHQTNESKESQSISQYSFTLSNGKNYTLTVETNLNEVTQVKDIIISLLPYMFLLDFTLSLICSLLYSRYITKPIIKLSEVSQHIANFNFESNSILNRDDEIGILSKNLDFLSQSLQSKINQLNDINSQLKTDIDKKREVEKTRLAFFATTSHELKTPITILKGHLNGMLDCIGDYADRDKYLKRSLDVTDQMEVLIKELLFIAQLEENKQCIHLREEDFAEIVRIELSNVIDLMDDKDLTLNNELPEHLNCIIDEAMLHIVLQNLIINAIHYSPNHEHINIKLFKDNHDVTFTIENTGVHIPEELLSKLFDAFYKIDTVRSSGVGTGLGLYIVRELLEKHNADYKIYNTSHGVKFEFSIQNVETYIAE